MKIEEVDFIVIRIARSQENGWTILTSSLQDTTGQIFPILLKIDMSTTIDGSGCKNSGKKEEDEDEKSNCIRWNPNRSAKFYTSW